MMSRDTTRPSPPFSSMTRDALRNSIQQLQSEIHKAEAGDQAALGHLHQLAMDIETALGEGGETARHQSLVARFREQVEQLEVQHPQATAILNEIMMTLSNLGI